MQHTGAFAWCRAGFEPDLAAEFTDRAAAAGIAGYARTERESGYVQFLVDAADAVSLESAVPWRDTVFSRSTMSMLAELKIADPTDRISPMLAALQGLSFNDVWVEHPDSDAGKPLSGLARSLGNALRPALKRARMLTPQAERRLHVLLLSGTHIVLGSTRPTAASPWTQGIPRLRMLAEAPSRSALKLEEALMTLLGANEKTALVKEGMRAADLGAAPGGWTWVLLREGMHVTAIDNGPLREHVMDTGRVTHLREDGFSWRPPQSLDWMVSDMVEQPVRVASRMATWIREGWCRQTIFNLKLPMKKRWLETQRCFEVIEREAERPLAMRAKQLYHDREEITVYCRAL